MVSVWGKFDNKTAIFKVAEFRWVLGGLGVPSQLISRVGVQEGIPSRVPSEDATGLDFRGLEPRALSQYLHRHATPESQEPNPFKHISKRHQKKESQQG